MELKPDIQELLSGFEKRMKFIHIARYLMDYPFKDSIKAMVPHREVLDNLIVAVLVFIKERTLGSEQRCTLEHIADFLTDIACLLPAEWEIDAGALARYIVVDVLQRGGVLVSYTVLLPDRQCFEPVPVRLLEEEGGSYHLTDDAFDYLFRTKEIESELDYSVTRFRMAEYMKRNNYTQAMDQSRELVSKIRNMKVSMDDFMRRCRENITRISVEQYESVITRIRSLLETEYEELKLIQDNARARAQALAQARKSGAASEDMARHRRALAEIIRNIQLTIEEQRGLINKKATLSETYSRILSDSYAMTRYERLSFERDMMAPLRSGQLPLDGAAAFLLFPLTRPDLEKRFSPESFYAIQDRLTAQAEQDQEDLGDEVEQEDPAALRNALFLDICTAFFAYLADKTSFRVSAFAASLPDDTLFAFCRENALPQVILNFYALQRIDISAWKASEEMIVQPVGEFELSWCLSELPQGYLALEALTVTKLERTFSFSVSRDGVERNIRMSDFLIEVTR